MFIIRKSIAKLVMAVAEATHEEVRDGDEEDDAGKF